ncbi:hypothetical protein Vafri_8374 [Volvox africanus]|nr:hypothetical protein Vafri_8374 [Volvox africanus]
MPSRAVGIRFLKCYETTTDPSIPTKMTSHPYLRFLARVSARQPLLRPPPDASLTQVNPSDLASLMPYTQPISGYRSRSFELRGLELRVAELPAVEQSSPCGSPGFRQPGSPCAGTSAAVATGPAHSHLQQHQQHQQHQHPQEDHMHQRQQKMQQSGPDDGAEGTPQTTLFCGPPPSLQPPRSPKSSTKTQPLAAPASPPHSYMEIHYPFTVLPWLWRQYHRPGFPGLDPALIIEDFDTFAADVAARHVGHVPESMLVTAFLERLTWHVHLRPGDGLVPAGFACVGGSSIGSALIGEDTRQLALLAPTDMRMAGQVTWVGRSSMEVLLQLMTAEAPATPALNHARASSRASDGPRRTSPVDAEGIAAAQVSPPPFSHHSHGSPPLVMLPPGQLVATAEFVMALRDSSLRRAVDVPPLHPQNDLERELFQRGREHQRQRQARRDKDRDVAQVASKQGSPPHNPSSAAVPVLSQAMDAMTAAGPDAGLARMLYDSVLRSDLARAVPRDVDGLRFLESDPEPNVMPEPVRGPRGSRPGCAKRPRIDGGNDGSGSHSQDGFPEPIVTAATADTLPLGSCTQDGCTDTVASTATVPTRQAEVHRTVIAEFQDRNTSGTVFGGHLLRLAYEHAATAAAAFAGGPCELMWLEEGAISSPARMGDMLHAVARVVWAEQGGRALRVVVRVGKYNVSSPSQHGLALTLTAAFLAPAAPSPPPKTAAEHAHIQRSSGNRNGRGLRGVLPTTLTEAGEALAAERRHEATMATLAQTEAMDGVSL